jgi:protease I
VDGNVITSRTPVDLPDFTRAIVAHLEGRPAGTQHATHEHAGMENVSTGG